MINYLQTFAVLGMGIFLYFAIIPSYPLMSLYSIVHAAVISCIASSPDCYGTYGDDNMKGDDGVNWISGLDGNDRLSGGAGNDWLHGGYGNDDLTGGPGNDDLFGSVGADSIKCGAGYDQVGYFNPTEGDTKSNDCERFYPPYLINATGISNDTSTGYPVNLTGFPTNLTKFPANQTLSATNSSSQ